MQSAVDLDIDQLRIGRDVTRQRSRRSHSRCRLLAIFAVFKTTFALCLSASKPALADDSLETMEGGLFHRKGWIDPEIYRRKPKRTRRKRALRRTELRTRHSTSSATRPCTASQPKLLTDVEQRERDMPPCVAVAYIEGRLVSFVVNRVLEVASAVKQTMECDTTASQNKGKLEHFGDIPRE
jgi:hypothetical protein